MKRFFAPVAVLLALVVASPLSRGAELELPDIVEFNRDIRPILSDNCYACHGPDAKTREAELRLDTKAGLFADLGLGLHVVKPGSTEVSAVVQRITSSDRTERMPPREAKKTLSPRQIALIRKWVEQGAKWQGHWAYIPPRQADVDAGAHPVDYFVRRKLDRAGFSSSPAADRRTLLRRLSFDLTGLPPTPAEVEAFENDQSPNAYEKQVDRLLASPRYGERMATFWLDLVRYADSIGYHSDNPRNVWMYRDYVIKAFNENYRFDRFTIEQIAGDLLPDATNEQKIASGYNRLLQTTQEGGAQPKEYIAKYAADRVRNISDAWMGATVGCAECHDHKFDPYTQRDFYSLAAFFADVSETAVGNQAETPMPTAEHEAKLAAIDAQIAAAEKELAARTATLADEQRAWEEKTRETVKNDPPQLGDWHVLGPFGAGSFDAAHDKDFGPEKGVDLSRTYNDGKLKWQGKPQFKDGQVHTLTGDNSATYLYRTITASRAEPLALSLGSDDSIQVWHNGTRVLNNKVARGVAPDQEKLTLQLTEGENRLLMKICNGSGGYGFYFKVLESGLPGDIVAIIRTAVEKRNDAQAKKLSEYFSSIAPSLKAPRDRVAQLKQQREALRKQLPTTLITTATNSRTMRILPRGNWLDDSGPEVQPNTPEFLPALSVEERRANRLDLAKWLLREDNPLVARTFVNRLYKLYFGYGLARTIEDNGAQGQWPTHPELLDWLAVEFIESGWDVKHMVKLLVMNDTYRQSSTPTPELAASDPYNKLYARQSRFRLEAEMVRDNALSISGLLAGEIGGPSVKPYQPAGYWQHLNFPTRRWQRGSGDELYRRGMYTWWQRSFLHPSLLAFDAPSREECVAERPRSNTPQQALVLLNDPTYVEAARVFAQRIVKGGGEDVGSRLAWAFGKALQREPVKEEVELLSGLLGDHHEQYQADPAAAKALLMVGEYAAPNDVDQAELAAWTSVARVILNLHETVMRY